MSTRMLTRGALAALGALLCFATTGALRAQTDVTTTRLSGTATAQEGGAPLPGVTVTITNNETGFSSSATTDARGFYRLLNLPSGNYALTAELDGFATASTEIRLLLGSTPSVDFVLPPASVSETITVTGEQMSLVDRTNTQASTTILTEDLENLPSAGRDYRNLVLLTPQTLVEPERRSLAISGQRGINTNVTIDGGDFNNSFFGGPIGVNEGRSPLSFSQESIKEMTVITNGASAEFGRSGGGVVNIVTKSGTNALHGSAFYYNQPESLIEDFANGQEPADQEKEQYGASLGGAIVKDKLFYFVSYDEQKRNEAIPISSQVLDADIFARYPELSSAPQYVQTQDGNVLFGRVDFQASPDHRFMLRYNRSEYEGINGTSNSSSRADTFNGIEANTTESLVGNWSSQWGTSFLNDFTATWVEDDTPRRGKGTDLVEIRLGGIRYGEESFLPVDSVVDRQGFVDSASYLTGEHVWKGGVEYTDTGIDQVFPSNWRGLYIFNNKADLLAGRWFQYQQQIGVGDLTAFEAGAADFRQKETAVFLQDQWFASPSMTLSFGLRYEKLDNPNDPILNPNDQNPDGTFKLTGHVPDDSGYSPRLGFSWAPDPKNAVRFSAGRFWSRTPALLLAQPFTTNALRGARFSTTATTTTVNGVQVVVAPPPGLAPGWGANFVTTGVPPLDESLITANTRGLEVFTIDPDFENPYTDRVTVGYEREINDATAAGIDLAWAEAKQLQRLTNLNRVYDGTIAANGLPRYSSTLPYPAYRRIVTSTSDATSEYWGVTLRVNRRFTGNFAYAAQVTYSEDKDDDSNERNFAGIQCEDFNDLHDACWGWSVRDQRWKGSASGVWQTPWWGIGLAGAFRYQTGRPYSALTAVDGNNDGEPANERPTINGVHFDRNSYRQPKFMALDLRVSKEFELGPGILALAADCFNCSDEANFTVPAAGQTWGPLQTPNSNFGQATTPGTPRTIQLSIRYDF